MESVRRCDEEIFFRRIQKAEEDWDERNETATGTPVGTLRIETALTLLGRCSSTPVRFEGLLGFEALEPFGLLKPLSPVRPCCTCSLWSCVQRRKLDRRTRAHLLGPNKSAPLTSYATIARNWRIRSADPRFSENACTQEVIQFSHRLGRPGPDLIAKDAS